MRARNVLRVDEGEPVGVDRAKRHVSPDVAVHHVSSHEKWNQDHQDRVGARPIERVKNPRVRKAVMRFVRRFIELSLC